MEKVFMGDKGGMNDLKVSGSTFLISPTRIQSIDFKTVEIHAEVPHVRVVTIKGLDDEILIPEASRLYIIASQECFSVKVDVPRPVTRRKLIRSVREAYRKIYQEARSLGVRNELDNLRELVLYSFEVKEDAGRIMLIPEVSVS